MTIHQEPKSQVAIHGMLHSHNFGDVLLAAAFRKWVLEASPQSEVVFPWAREACLKDIHAGTPGEPLPLPQSAQQAKILFCGGQYVNDGNSTKGAYRRFRNIQGKGVFGRLRGARYAAFGIGIGPLGTLAGKFLNAAFLRGADVVAVREEDSLVLARKLGVPEKKLVLVSDAAIAYVDELSGLTKKAPVDNDRTLLLHISLSNEALVLGIEKYLKQHGKIYSRIVVTADKLGKSPVEAVKEYLKKAGFPVTVCDYTSHLALIDLINKSDDVLTTKYHVGIVAGALGKRVCAIPWNHYKVQRFYQEVGSAGSCQPLGGTNAHSVAKTLEKAFVDSAAVKLPEGMQKRSSDNKQLVNQWISQAI